MKANLNALRVFVSVARCGSFTQAAYHLNVTQGAVSQQVARLETYLGLKLFRRDPRTLTLTMAGQRLFRNVSTSIERIDAEVDATRVGKHTHVLTLSTISSFAAKWLMPRLEGYQKTRPDVKIHCESTARLVDLSAEGVDLGIRFGNGTWAHLQAIYLLAHHTIAVARPAYAATINLQKGPAALEGVPLFFDLESPTEWPRWLRAAGIAHIEPNMARGFSDTLVMLSALINDADGVALIGEHLIQQELQHGTLISLFELPVESDGAYYLIYPAGQPLSSTAKDFADWIVAEAG